MRCSQRVTMGSAIKETYSDQYVTYTLEVDWKFYIVEHVPSRECLESGEQYFASETVEKMQNIIWGQSKPVKLIETPVWHGWKYRIGKGKRMLF